MKKLKVPKKKTAKPSPAELKKMKAMEAKETPADEAMESPAEQRLEKEYGVEKHSPSFAKSKGY